LDNAIEAAQKVPNPSGRFISLTIRRINHMILIRVENSFEKAPMTEGGTLRTTKTEGGLHGFGVKSARAAAEKYDGTLQTSFEGNVFRAVATLSLP
jgi:sensor histidine kinase YesM